MTDPNWPPPAGGAHAPQAFPQQAPQPQAYAPHQAPAYAPQAPGGLMLRTSFFPLAWILYFCPPKISIDGSPAIEMRWGDHLIPGVPPGPHRVRVWFRYLFMGDCGVADAVVHVPEQGLFLEYKAPTWFVWSRGRFPALEQQAAPQVPQGPQAGAWHPDPTGRAEQRFWDGQQWTGHVVRAGQQGWDPV